MLRKRKARAQTSKIQFDIGWSGGFLHGHELAAQGEASSQSAGTVDSFEFGPDVCGVMIHHVSELVDLDM